MIARYVGMDIHKHYAQVTAVDREHHVVLPSERVSMALLAAWCAQHLTVLDSVVIEVTTNTWAIVDILERYAGIVVVANPYKTKLIAEAHIKNDKVDALVLARLLASNFICEVWVPTPRIRTWRRLARHRGRLRCECTRAKNRLQHLLQTHNLRCPERDLFSGQGRAWLAQQAWSVVDAGIVRHLLAQVDLLEEQIRESEQQMAQLAYQDARVTQVMQISGVGLYTAFTIIAIIGAIDRFPSARKLSAYVGLVPREHQSGKRAYRGHITKAGDRLLRWLMIEAAQAAVRWEPHWREVHARIAQRRGSSIATVAVARKLLVTIWHLLSENTVYYYLRPKSYVRKLQDWAYCIGRGHLPASSSKDFVADQLRAIDLDDMAEALVTTGRNSRLTIAMPAT